MNDFRGTARRHQEKTTSGSLQQRQRVKQRKDDCVKKAARLRATTYRDSPRPWSVVMQGPASRSSRPLHAVYGISGIAARQIMRLIQPCNIRLAGRHESDCAQRLVKYTASCFRGALSPPVPCLESETAKEGWHSWATAGSQD
jgi:hypothetical protein